MGMRIKLTKYIRITYHIPAVQAVPDAVSDLHTRNPNSPKLSNRRAGSLVYVLKPLYIEQLVMMNNELFFFGYVIKIAIAIFFVAGCRKWKHS